MAILAINGGPKTINHTLGKSWPIFGKEEESALLSILHSGQWYRRGALPDSSVTQFEDAFAAYQNAKHCVAVCTGTQALEVALLASGVQPGDEVIVPAASFIAVAPIVRHPKVTAWGFYFLNLRFNSQEFDGITRDRFVEAIQADRFEHRAGPLSPHLYP